MAFCVVIVVAANALDAVSGISQNGCCARPAVNESLRLLTVGLAAIAFLIAAVEETAAGYAEAIEYRHLHSTFDLTALCSCSSRSRTGSAGQAPSESGGLDARHLPMFSSPMRRRLAWSRPARARTTLFQAFQTSNRKGGSGLGLAISAELAAAHGGSLRLLDTPKGAAFRLEIPDRTVA